jgi:ribosomal protein S18
VDNGYDRPSLKKDILARGKIKLRKIEGKRAMQQRGNKYV